MSVRSVNQRSDEPAAAPTKKLFFSVFPSIALPMFLAVLDQTIVATALPAIAASLGDVTHISWVVTSYLIAATVAAPVYGRLGDAFGRRRLMFAGLAILIVGSALCAVAPNLLFLSLARVLQGLGGGGLMTSSQALIGQMIPPRERGRYQGYLAAVVVSSSAFGPVVGGYLTQHLGWPAIFLINLPIGFVAALLLMRLPRQSSFDDTVHLDLRGLALFITFAGATLLAIDLTQHFDSERSLAILVVAMSAVVALIVFVRHEWRNPAPLLPIALMRMPAIWRCDALAACHGAALVSLITFLPLYLRVVPGASASESGLLLLPLTASVGLGAVITGRLVSKTGRTFVFPSCGLVVSVIAVVCLALLAPQLSRVQMSCFLAVYGAFMGTAMGVVNVTVQSMAGPTMLGAAAGAVQFSRLVGAGIGTAIVGSVLFLSLSAVDSEAAGLFKRVVELGPDVLAGLGQARRAAVQTEIADAFRAAFLVVGVFTAGALVLSWLNPIRRVV